MAQTVTIHGPNLADQSKGDFHVHSASCLDNKKYRGSAPWTATFDSIEELTEELYSDIIAEDEDSSWENYVGTIWFAPCTDLK